MRFFGMLFLSLCIWAVLIIGILDWWGGCGESWIQADGTRVQGECIGRNLFFGDKQ